MTESAEFQRRYPDEVSIVTQEWEPENGYYTNTWSAYICADCGSLVLDTVVHDRWHANVLTQNMVVRTSRTAAVL